MKPSHVFQLLLVVVIPLILAAPIPDFIIDFDLPSSIRYNHVFEHYKEQLKETQMLFVHSVMPQYRELFKTNQEVLRKVNPHAFDAMESLARIVGIETYEALLVNSIVDFSSFCTSIVARDKDNMIIHARNLDFDFPSKMSKLVYNAVYKKNGVTLA